MEQAHASTSAQLRSDPARARQAELFGHTKGAFTGADRARPGYFRQANLGTLLLDEFLELPPKTQAKLLRVLEEWEVQPVGESRAEKINVLVLAATQSSLAQSVEAGQLRNDLVARLGVITVRLPALEERREDIPPLFRFFVQQEAAQRARSIRADRMVVLAALPQNVASWSGWRCDGRDARRRGDVRLEHLPAQYGRTRRRFVVDAEGPRMPPPMPSNAPTASKPYRTTTTCCSNSWCARSTTTTASCCAPPTPGHHPPKGLPHAQQAPQLRARLAPQEALKLVRARYAPSAFMKCAVVSSSFAAVFLFDRFVGALDCVSHAT